MPTKQITLGNILDENDIPIGPGDYVEHKAKPGISLLVIEGPTTSATHHICYKVKEPKGNVISVCLEYIHRI